MQRHRVVHSVRVDELEPDSRVFEAWHAKSDTIWSVNAADLIRLAADLKQCAAQADDFGTKWEERASRDGWSDLGLIPTRVSKLIARRTLLVDRSITSSNTVLWPPG
jgi:hypothetical protein